MRMICYWLFRTFWSSDCVGLGASYRITAYVEMDQNHACNCIDPAPAKASRVEV
jgi:hypothetical protein